MTATPEKCVICQEDEGYWAHHPPADRPGEHPFKPPSPSVEIGKITGTGKPSVEIGRKGKKVDISKKWPPEAVKPFAVEVNDHSDDLGTEYILIGPSTCLLGRDKDLLDCEAENMNWGWEQHQQTILTRRGLDRLESATKATVERDLTPEEAQVEVEKRGPSTGYISITTMQNGKLQYHVHWTKWEKTWKEGEHWCSSGKNWLVHGHGDSFRAAFASADKARGGK
jgi:hypothetical protein